MRIHYLQHVPFEGPGSLERWALSNGHTRSTTRLYDGELPAKLEEIDALVILGGPMNVYEEERHPWLVTEKAFIKQALESDRLILGICLGAQLIADVLRAKVYRNQHKEIGWFPVELTDQARESPIFGELPSKFTAFHWHGDTFDLPPGATHIAKSEGCSNQAFVFDSGRVVGLQFHLEWTRAILAETLRDCAGDLSEGRYVQSPDEMLSRDGAFEQNNEMMDQIAERLTAMGVSKSAGG
jgi:GMP synthase-like glutamine amidotransferase